MQGKSHPHLPCATVAGTDTKVVIPPDWVDVCMLAEQSHKLPEEIIGGYDPAQGVTAWWADRYLAYLNERNQRQQ